MGMGDWTARLTNFGGYAVANDIIMVYPQIKWGRNCHDTFGYTGDDFATKKGIQPRFFEKVVERLTSEIDPERDYTWYNVI